MTPPPSGQQFSIGHGEQRAVIVEVGGGIRQFRVGDRDVLEPYHVAAMPDGGRGAALIPWPNRLADGKYRFDGVDHQLALSEPAKQNAIHGLLRWRPWCATEHKQDEVTMRTTLHPRKGYPFHLDVAIRYALSDAGLTVTTTATNLGDTAAPYGCGHHPYLSPGTGPIDAAVLRFDAATRIIGDPDRQLPIGTESVRGTPFDFAAAKPLGTVSIDHPFTDLARADDGRAWVRLTGADAAVAELWVDDSYPVIQLFTGDTLAPARRRTGLAVEPMTCPPNAFQSGDRLIRLAPGATVATRWGARLTRA
ncbi:aldose epimerase [Nocardia brasiliensis]|uniref:Aldose epimerase n=1 Tax=Nocardia brasiliensis TaxID=37326 RepID=A0A6G9XX08_NOCBR|nr:aldose 1-epimerase family protein [Nocardia brasiliensis]QIS05464.1 aldose epimerase [Nocardia brasiliensis]